jgi:hypothetical protein
MSKPTPHLRYLLLFLFPLILFAGTIFGGRALFWGTPLNQFVPWWVFSWESILSGIFPFWNDLLGMGAPLIANYQSALFYPLTWVYFLAYAVGGTGGMAWFLAIMVVLHLFWAALGMALLIRSLQLNRQAQIVGGLAFGLSGYLVARAGFLSINAAVAWLPWIILGITKLINAYNHPNEDRVPAASPAGILHRKTRSAFLLLVGAVTMQLLAGHAQTTWYSLLLAITWFIFMGIIEPWIKQRRMNAEAGQGAAQEKPISASSPGLWFKPGLRLVLLFGVAIVLAAMLAGMQLLPTAEYLLESQRAAAVDYEFAMSYSFWPWRFLSFLAPGLFGNPALGDYWGYANYWEDAVYIGLIPFVLAVVALSTSSKVKNRGSILNSRWIWFLGILILGSFLLALGRNTPIFPWLYRNFPTFDMFQAPTRISVLAIFALSILAAVGVHSWSSPSQRQAYWLRLGVMAAVAITIGAGLALLLTRNLALDIRPSFIRSAAWLGLWGVCLGWLALKAPINTGDENWSWWHWAVIFVVGTDLVVAGWGVNPSVPLDVYTEPAPTADQVQQYLGEGRIYLGSEDEEELKFGRFLRFDTFQPFNDGDDWHSLKASLLPNITLLDNLPSANNFDPLIPGRYSEWMEALGQVEPQVKDQMLNLMGVTVVESIELNSTNAVKFENRGAYPRLRWVSCGVQVEEASTAFELIRSGRSEINSQVLLEADDLAGPAHCSDQIEAQLQVQHDASNKMSVLVNSQADGYLVLADTWYPGWQVAVDNSPAKLQRANYLFKAVFVSAGEHQVDIYYRPRSFFLGAIITIAGVLLLAVVRLTWNRLKLS